VGLASDSLRFEVLAVECRPAVVRGYLSLVDGDDRESLKRARCGLRVVVKNQGLEPVVMHPGDPTLGPVGGLLILGRQGGRQQVAPFARMSKGHPQHLGAEATLDPGDEVELLLLPVHADGPMLALQPALLRTVEAGFASKHQVKYARLPEATLP
jgi:hypothetical protein